MKLTDNNWEEFLIWLKEAHHLSSIYTPNREAVKLWQEFEEFDIRRGE